MGAYPRVVDFDEDGKKDIVSGDSPGQISFFKNIGTLKRPNYDLGTKVKSNGKVITAPVKTYTKDKDGKYRAKVVTPGSHELAEKYSKIDIADWNGDGLLDILVGHSAQQFVVYYNVGEKGAPKYSTPCVVKPKEGNFPSRPSPHVADWDQDGVKDLLVGSETGEIYFYKNRGTNKKPLLVSGIQLKAGGKVIKEGSRARLDVMDWNNDGKLDLVVGNYFSVKDPEAPRGRRSGGNLWLYLQK